MDIIRYRTLRESLAERNDSVAYEIVAEMKEKGLNPISIDEAWFQQRTFGTVLGTPVMIRNGEYIDD